MPSPPRSRHWLDLALAWYFVSVWGSGFIASKAGIQYAAPFTFLALRFALGVMLMIPIVVILRPRWPSREEWPHVLVVGFLIHAFHLSGSHYAQYLGLSAGVTALIMALQPVITAIIAAHWLREPLGRLQWLGISLGLFGVGLVVWHKIDVHVMTAGSLIAILCGLAGMTAGTLYQRRFCPQVDLYSSTLIQFLLSLAVLVPLSFAVEGARIEWSWQLWASVGFLVVFSSILAVNALHTLMRHGEAARITSMIYLTPIFAVVLEYLLFDVVPTALTVAGIAATCAGVALVVLRRRNAMVEPNG
jgi:drug/metabolite transporter (DMT)-like permease